MAAVAVPNATVAVRPLAKSATAALNAVSVANRINCLVKLASVQ